MARQAETFSRSLHPSPLVSPRLVLLTLLLVAPSGCLGRGDVDGPRLATPTDTPVVVPSKTPTPVTPPVDFNDPGFPFTVNWKVGDGWDYDSNESRWRSIRVKESVVVGNRTLVRVDQVDGEYHGPAPIHMSAWFDATGPYWARLNSTSAKITTTMGNGSIDVHYYRNGTLFWNETREGKRTSIAIVSRFTDTESVSTRWGTVRTGVIEHRWAYSTAGVSTRTLVVHRVSNAWGNDVDFTVNGEVYTLVGVRYGNVSLGALRLA